MLSACSKQPVASQPVPRVPPKTLDDSLVRSTNQGAPAVVTKITQLLEQRTLTDPVGAIYDFDAIPGKAIFFAGAGRGTGVDRGNLLYAALVSIGNGGSSQQV